MWMLLHCVELHLIQSKFKMNCFLTKRPPLRSGGAIPLERYPRAGKHSLSHSKSTTDNTHSEWQVVDRYHSGSASQVQTAGLKISGSPQVGSQQGTSEQWTCGCLKQISPEFYSQSYFSFGHTKF